VYYIDLCDITGPPSIGPEWTPVGDGLFFRFSSGMRRAWDRHPGELRLLARDNPEFWCRFLAGEEPKKTRGAA
jgi:hypothetical protein